jgi:hypothetical protein
MTTDVTIDDFLSGVIAGCRDKGYRTISLRENTFYANVKASYDQLAAVAESKGLDLRFRIFLDPLHHDSPVVEQAITTAVQRKLVSLDNPEFVNMRIKLNKDEAAELLADLPGGADLYKALAETFIDRSYMDAPAPA